MDSLLFGPEWDAYSEREQAKNRLLAITFLTVFPFLISRKFR